MNKVENGIVVGGRRQGSMILVICSAVILGMLAMAAVTMSQHAGRKEYHQGMRASAREVARIAAEEAALLLNNGHANASIEDAIDAAEPLELNLESPLCQSGALADFGLPPDAKPRVTLRASPVNRFQRNPGREQLDQILAEVAKGGFDQEVVDFWDRVKKEKVDGIDDEGNFDEGNIVLTYTDADRNDGFMSMARGVRIQKWGPKGHADECIPQGTTPETYEIKPHKRDNPNDLDGKLRDFFYLFYDRSADEPVGQTVCQDDTAGPNRTDLKSKTYPRVGGTPGPMVVKEKFREAIVAVGNDAASKLQGCGSNPSGAVAHTVGDLAYGEVIASGTEVNVTTNFMKSRELQDNKVYLLEISAEMEYGETKNMDLSEATGSRPKVHYTTYRLFSKIQWEQAVLAQTHGYDPATGGGEPGKGFISEFMDAGLSPAQIANMYPPVPDEPDRNMKIPGTNTRYDPKKVIWDVLAESDMPVTAGGRMYPYTLAATHTDAKEAETHDIEPVALQ